MDLAELAIVAGATMVSAYAVFSTAAEVGYLIKPRFPRLGDALTRWGTDNRAFLIALRKPRAPEPDERPPEKPPDPPKEHTS